MTKNQFRKWQTIKIKNCVVVSHYCYKRILNIELLTVDIVVIMFSLNAITSTSLRSNFAIIFQCVCVCACVCICEWQAATQSSKQIQLHQMSRGSRQPSFSADTSSSSSSFSIRFFRSILLHFFHRHLCYFKCLAIEQYYKCFCGNNNIEALRQFNLFFAFHFNRIESTNCSV